MKAINTQAEAVLYFLQQMDMEMLDDLLDPGLTYQDLPKWLFMHKLTAAIDKFKESGDKFLNCHGGRCKGDGCENQGCAGFSFIGDQTGDYMNLIVDIKQGKLVDMYECADFQIEEQRITRRHRIRMNEDDLPF